MFRRINFIDPRTQNTNRAPARFQRGLMRNRIHAARKSADHRDSIRCEKRRKFFGDLPAIRRDSARANDGNRKQVIGQIFAADIQHGRRLVNFF